ncbi:hypothetical protein QFC21_001015 [Naganishia friedmannii]|uniref:Uncharacterized protein n=1 Tax=Naganishia friedmannii TaxID=89922 RepID=A0ACC2W808_9TREE|nr:hypothetical protein QFC21_001015 [Naganishia friedmannii]
MQQRVADVRPDHFTYTTGAMNGTEMALGLQPPAHIYDPRSSATSNGLSAYDSSSANHRLNLQQRNYDPRLPFVNVYQQFTSVPLSAIQPLEHSPYNPRMMNQNIPTQQACNFSYDAHCVSPNLPDSPTDSRPGTASSTSHTVHPQPHGGPPPLLDRSRGWSGPMVSLSLQQPYQVHTFMANSDGTISNFTPSPYIPSDRTKITPAKRAPLKRSADDTLEAEVRRGGDVDGKGKRRCMDAQKTREQMSLSISTSPPWQENTWEMEQPSPLAEVSPPIQDQTPQLRPRRGQDCLPDTPPASSPPDARRAISAAARAQSITEHVVAIYRSYAKPKSPTTSDSYQLGTDTPIFVDDYQPVLPAFPDLSGDELMLSDDNDPDDQLSEDHLSPTNAKQARGTKKSSRATKGHDKVSNRVAARRHREMTKERLKNLEKLRAWLDDALTEYEKSNQRLHETFSKLQEENNKQMRHNDTSHV